MDWPIVPICYKQRLDINIEDIIDGGLFRTCDIYRGGRGYDRFNEIFHKRFGWVPNSKQFVVQLRGCPLNCNYCYVTKDGIWGEPVVKSTDEIIESYKKSLCDVFHLMGGAPALYLDYWKEIANKVKVFHSDFILFEQTYKYSSLKDLVGLFAINFKDHCSYGRREINNFEMILSSNIHFYITFTGKPTMRDFLIKNYKESILDDSFEIPINYNYNALKELTNGR